MARRIGFLVAAVMALGLAAGCASKQEFQQLVVRVNEMETRAASVESSVASVNKSVGDVNANLRGLEARLNAVTQQATESRKQIDAIKVLVAETTKQLASLDTRLGNQVKGVRDSVKTLDARFTKMTSSLDQAQTLFVKNLENTRDIHEMQYKALSEILEKIKRPQPKKKGK